MEEESIEEKKNGLGWGWGLLIIFVILFCFTAIIMRFKEIKNNRGRPVRTVAGIEGYF